VPVTSNQVAISAAAAAVKVVDQGGKAAPVPMLLSNVGANACHVGGPGVNAGSGYPLAAGASLPQGVVLSQDDDEIYVFSTLGTTVAFLAVT
jgi:hypothetical protein